MSKRKIGVWIVIILMVIWTLLPLYWFGKFAFMNNADISAFPPKFYPTRILLSGFFTVLGFTYEDPWTSIVYRPIGQSEQIVRGFLNSLIVSITVTAITVVVVIPLGYVFGRLEFRFKNVLLIAILLSVLLPPVSVLIPFFIIYNKIGLTGTLAGMVIITLTITIPFITWMVLGYFRNLPNVEPLARIDGFSRFGTFFKITIPMARTGIFVTAIISFLFAWNEFTFAQLLVTATSAATLPAVLSGFLTLTPQTQQLSTTVIYSIIISLVAIYFLQKNLTKMNIVEVVGG
jgi:multiple sugar transport system permease protein